jgi:hypothetical protein
VSLIVQAVRRLAITEKMDVILEALNREFQPVLKLCRDIINQRHGRIALVTEDYTVTDADEELRVRTAGVNILVTLPDSFPEGRELILINSAGGLMSVMGKIGGVTVTTQLFAGLGTNVRMRYDADRKHFRIVGLYP